LLLDRLDASLRRLPKPEWVWLNPFADAFVPQSDSLATDTLLVLRTLLNLGIGVTLRTRGGLPLARPLVLLARRFPHLLRVEVAFFTSERTLHNLWERGTASLPDRLSLCHALSQAGADVVARIGPIIPMVNDTESSLQSLLRSISAHGVDQVSLSWIKDTPGLRDQIAREVSRSKARVLGGFFEMGQGDGMLSDHIKEPRFNRIARLCQPLGLHLIDCYCCPAGMTHCLQGPKDREARQMTLLS